MEGWWRSVASSFRRFEVARKLISNGSKGLFNEKQLF